MCALRPPFTADSFPALKRVVTTGKYAPIPKNFSDSLQRVISHMLRLTASSRPSATALLKMPELAAKLYLDDDTTSFAQNGSEKGILNLIGTIRVPSNMGKLNSALPKPCYPDVRPNSPTAWTVAEQKDFMVRRPAALPPLAPSEDESENRCAQNGIPSIVSSAVNSLQLAAKFAAAGLEEYYTRRPLAPINSEKQITRNGSVKSTSSSAKQSKLDAIVPGPTVPMPPSNPNSAANRAPKRKSLDKPPSGYAPVRGKENSAYAPTAPSRQPAGAPSRAQHYRRMW